MGHISVPARKELVAFYSALSDSRQTQRLKMGLIIQLLGAPGNGLAWTAKRAEKAVMRERFLPKS